MSILAPSRRAAVLSRPGSTGWTPLALGASLIAWWNPDDYATKMTDDGAGLISSFTDRILGRAATAATTARPTYGATAANGRAGLTYDGVANCMAWTSFTGMPTGSTDGSLYSSYINANTGGAAASCLISYGINSGVGQRMCRLSSNTPPNATSYDGATTGSSEGQPGTTNPAVQAAMFPGGTVMQGQLNGGAIQTTTIASLNTGTTRGRLGASTATAANIFFSGVKRHDIITRALSDADHDRLVGWLAWDIGAQAQLPSTHPYANHAP